MVPIGAAANLVLRGQVTMSQADAKRLVADSLAAGRQALTHGAWEEARACLETAVAEQESPEALELGGLVA